VKGGLVRPLTGNLPLPQLCETVGLLGARHLPGHFEIEDGHDRHLSQVLNGSEKCLAPELAPNLKCSPWAEAVRWLVAFI
jgi:hypothetical protein